LPQFKTDYLIMKIFSLSIECTYYGFMGATKCHASGNL
jgi:hypothetical protein